MTTSPFTWSQLHPETPLSVEAARAAITALATLAGQPRVVLEATGREGAVAWKLGCQAHDASRVIRALEAHLGHLRAERRPSTLDGLRADLAAGVRVRGSRYLPLRHDATEPSSRGVLAALAGARKGELIHLQLILGARHSPSAGPPVESAQRRIVALKHGEHRFACEVRIGASCPDPARSRRLIDGVAAALRSLEVPGVQIRLVRTAPAAFSRARTPLLWPNHLSVSDLVPMTGWPIGHLPLPGVPAPHPRLLAPTKDIPRRGRLLGVAATDHERPIALTAEDSLRHLHLLGPTGVGKSTLLGNLALSDIAQDRGVVVIDPKGDLINDLLARIPQERLDDVVVLDAHDREPVGINGLTAPGDADLAADSLLAVFHSLYANSWGPRTNDILHACLLTLARRGDASLVMVPLLLTNPGFRRSVVGRIAKVDPMGLGSFWGWFEGISDAERSQAIAPLMNKLRPVLLRPGIRGVLGQRSPKFDLSEVFTKQRILLVSLSKGSVGPEAAQLLGSVVVSLLWNAALARVSVPASQRRPVMVHIDEVQDYLRLPGDLGDALAQARGLGVGFTLAHQHLGQLPGAIREAVLANARSRVAFQLTGSDAAAIAKTSRGELRPDDFEALPAFQAYASLLVGGSPGAWTSLATQPLPSPSQDPAAVRARSRARFGQPLDEIEADLLSLLEPQHPASDRLGRTQRPISTDGDDHV